MKKNRRLIIFFILIVILGVVAAAIYPRAAAYQKEQQFIAAYKNKKDFDAIYGVIKENLAFIAKDPTDDSAYYSLGQGYFALGAWDEAIDAFHHALALSPKSDYILTWIGKAYQGKKDYANVIEVFSKALEANPAKKENYTQLAWIYYFRTNKETAKAYDVLKKGLEKFPNDKDLLFDITRYSLYDRNVAEFKKYAPLYRAIDPTYKAINDGWDEVQRTGKLK